METTHHLDPTLALKSPSITKQSPCGKEEIASCRVAKKPSFSFLLAAKVVKKTHEVSWRVSCETIS